MALRCAVQEVVLLLMQALKPSSRPVSTLSDSKLLTWLAGGLAVTVAALAIVLLKRRRLM